MNDESLRLEIVHLKELRQNNLVVFVGACLEWPNVCILTEICPKVGQHHIALKTEGYPDKSCHFFLLENLTPTNPTITISKSG